MTIAEDCGYDSVLALIDQKQKIDLFMAFPELEPLTVMIY